MTSNVILVLRRVVLKPESMVSSSESMFKPRWVFFRELVVLRSVQVSFGA